MLVAVSTALYFAVSYLDWWRFELDSYDLAIYHEVVWHLSRFQAPAVSLLGESNYFADHFSPILALWAPLYWIAASPVFLIAGQAILVAASIPPVIIYARRRVGGRCALILGVAYAQSWGVWAALDASVHEVAFACPLVAWAICFSDRRRYGPAYACLGALLLVKEDSGLILMAFGVMLALRGEGRRGLKIAAAGLIGLLLVNEVILPAMTGGHWSSRDAGLYGAYGDTAGRAALHLATHPGQLAAALFGNPQKVRLIVLLLGAWAGLPLLSTLSIVALPQIVERLLANDPNLWAPLYQYSLVTMVIFAMASADGVARITDLMRGRRVVPEAVAVVVAVISIASAAQPARLFHTHYLDRPERARATARAVAAIPAASSVAGDWNVLAHLPPTDTFYRVSQQRDARTSYLVLPAEGQFTPNGFRTVADFGQVRVYRRRLGSHAARGSSRQDQGRLQRLTP